MQARHKTYFLGGRIALTEGFMVTGLSVGYREIHAAGKLG